jgi:hypothetical protein
MCAAALQGNLTEADMCPPPPLLLLLLLHHPAYVRPKNCQWQRAVLNTLALCPSWPTKQFCHILGLHIKCCEVWVAHKVLL